MNNYIIAYDIFNPKRLPKVRKVVYSYTLEGQKSALEAPLDGSSMKFLVAELLALVEEEDKVNIIRVSNPILLGKAKSIAYENNGVIIV